MEPEVQCSAQGCLLIGEQDRVWRSLDLPECSSLVTRCSHESLNIMPFVFLLRIFQRRNSI